MDVCVCLSGVDGRVMEGRATLFRHHREVSRVQIPGRMGLPWMLCCIRVVLSRKEKRGGRGKYPGAPPHIRKKREEKQAVRKLPDRPVVVKGKRLQLKNNNNNNNSVHPKVFA
jgi:hypothetical protein